MKKSVLQIAASLLLALTLTACSQDAVKETEGPTAPVYTGDETQPTGADTPSEKPTEPAKPEMLGYDENGFSVWPEGNYLADPKFDTEEYLPDFDVDNDYIREVSMLCVPVCSTEETAYIAKRTLLYRRSFFLMFTDKATGITLPLCGRPECTHDGEDCNSYMGQETNGLQIYDGKIYWTSMIDSEYSLMRMNLDGSGREKVARMDWDADFIVLHRGYIYTVHFENIVTDGENQQECKVLAQPLGGGESFTVLDRVRAGSLTGKCFFMPVGNDIYIVLNGDIHGEEYLEIFKWSSKTRTSELLYDADGWEYYISRRPYPKAGDGLYFSFLDSEEDKDYCHLMRYSFEEGTFNEICAIHVDDGFCAMVTEKHIVVCEHRKGEEANVKVYDYDGNLVTESGALGKQMTVIPWSGEDDKYIYLQYISITNGKNSEGVFAIPLDGGEIVEIEWETFD